MTLPPIAARWYNGGMKTNLLPVVGAAAVLAGCATVKEPAYDTLIMNVSYTDADSVILCRMNHSHKQYGYTDDFLEEDGIYVFSAEESEPVVVAAYGAASATSKKTTVRGYDSVTDRKASRTSSKSAPVPAPESVDIAMVEYDMAEEGVHKGEHTTSETSYMVNNISAGLLTAGEVNDFAKWGIWPEYLAKVENKKINNTWGIQATQRYMVQVVSPDGYPMVNIPVTLNDAQGNTLFQARTDNTGKAELWNGLVTPPTKGKLTIKTDGQTIAAIPFERGINTIILQEKEPCKIPMNADVFFIIDATGSMGDELHYLQAEMKDVIARSQSAVEGLAIRTGALVYRDHGDNYLTRIMPLNNNIEETQRFIDQQHAMGGGDFEEAVPEALMATINAAGWNDEARARIAFLVLDAPCHHDSVTLSLLHEQILNAAAYGIRLVPVVCSGLDEKGELLMRSLSLATNGTSFFLTDDSGIGGTHLKPSTDSIKVEHLNDMLVRTIIEFTRMPDCNTQEWVDEAMDDDPIEQFLPNPTDDKTIPDITSTDLMISAFPNPCSQFCTVTLPCKVEAIYLLDVSGKTVRIFPAHDAGNMELDVRNLSTGVYFIKVYAQNRWLTAKILVQGNF